MKKRIISLLANRTLHFLCGGLLLFVVFGGVQTRDAAPPPLTLDPARFEQLRAGWLASMGSDPSAAEMEALRQRELDDEILLHEALARSVHLFDPVVRQRLLLNMRFLGASEEVSDDSLFAQALELGMHRSDVVVRRRLVQIMEMSIEEGADRSEPQAAELEQLYRERTAELTLPARWRITQVYFSGDRRGEQMANDAKATLAQLAASETTPTEAVRLGDPFLGGHQLPLLGEAQLAAQFGTEFAAGLPTCEVQRWCGPVASGFGLHLVFVQEFHSARLPAIDDPLVQKRLRVDLMRLRAERHLATVLAGLRSKYGVRS